MPGSASRTIGVSILLSVLVFGGWPAPASAGSPPSTGHRRGLITQYPIPTPQARPYGVAVGLDGKVWFTEEAAGKLGGIGPSGNLKEFVPGYADAGPRDLTMGADGSLFFTMYNSDLIGKINPSGRVRYYPIPTDFAEALGIAQAPDGTIWFTESGEADQIGILTLPLGYIEEIPLGFDYRPSFIAAGPDGAMWFTGELGNVIGRVDVATRAITYYLIPTLSALPWDITAGPDGAMWFTELAGRNIGRIDMSGNVTEYPIPKGFGSVTGIAEGFDSNLWFVLSDDSSLGSVTTDGRFGGIVPTGQTPNEIVAGSDGNLWFTERGSSNAIAVATVAPPGDASVIATDDGFVKPVATVPFGGQVRWIFQGPNPHSVTDQLGLFDSGPLPVGSVQAESYQAAGTYPYLDSGDPRLTGSVRVPVVAPSTGQVGVPFKVSWAAAQPPGYVFDVQVRTPGAAWSTWQDGVTDLSADYTATEAGSYGFRAALRLDGGSQRSGWSPASVVEVGSPDLESGLRFFHRHGYLVPNQAGYRALKQAAADGAAGLPVARRATTTAGQPVIGASFEGQFETDVAPPDPTGAIGPNSYLETVNLQIGLYDRSAGLIAAGPFEDLVGGNHFHYSDPQVLWDPDTQRFYFEIWDFTSATFRWGFSKTDDPRTLDGTSFCTYISGFGYSNFDAPDYPKLGQTKDFLLIGVNHFKDFYTYQGGDLLWIKKPQGSGPITTCPSAPATGRFADIRSEDGSRIDAPIPARQTDPSHVGYVVGIPYNVEGTGDFVSVFTVGRNPSNGRPRLSIGRIVPVDAYTLPPYAPQCTPQDSQLDTLDGRLEQAVSAIDPSTGAVQVWTAHAVTGGAGSEVRWYEIASAGRDPSLTRSGTVTDPSSFVWNGAISPDRTVNPSGSAHGDAMVLGYSRSSSSACPSVQMVSQIGSGPQSDPVTVYSARSPLVDSSCAPICRWGDYGGASPDPGSSLDAAHGDVWLANEVVLGDPNGAGGSWIWQATPA